MGLTPLVPGCNHMDIMGQHLMLLRRGEAIMKPVYRHSDGTFAPPAYLTPGRFLIVEGLLGYHTDALRDCFDIRVFLDPPESLRRRWKVVRDCSRRGYTTNQVLDELDRREPDSEAFIRPQRQHADIVVSFLPNSGGDQEHLDAQLVLRPSLKHPDFRSVLDGEAGAVHEQNLLEVLAVLLAADVVRPGGQPHPMLLCDAHARADVEVEVEDLSTLGRRQRTLGGSGQDHGGNGHSVILAVRGTMHVP
jgi:phosphoribulokinase